MAGAHLQKVLDQLKLYEHPVLDFGARQNGDDVEVVITFKSPDVKVQTYLFPLHARDIESPSFEWQFQRQLYDCLHDYFIEMFIRTPQDLKDRQARERG